VAFPINTNREPKFRQALSARDREYVKNCRTCPVAQLCGPNFSLWNDARWCSGPGEICMDGCRAICSRSPDKVEMYAKLMGEEHYEMKEWKGEVRAVPKLGIKGLHPWKPWAMNQWPDVGFQLNAHADNQHQPLYTVSLKHLFYVKRKTWSPQKDLRKRFHIPDSAMLAITTTCGDPLMDELEFQMADYPKRLAEYEGVDFILAPNFSIYDNYPRMDQLFRMKFRWLGMERLQALGMNVVPSICFTTKIDYENQIAWMRDNKATVFLRNFQTNAVTTDTPQWRGYMKATCAVRDAVGDDLQLIAYGAVGGARMLSVIENYGNNVTFIDAKSYRLAEYHKDIYEVVDKAIPPKVLAQNNFKMRREQIAEAKGRSPVPALECTAKPIITAT